MDIIYKSTRALDLAAAGFTLEVVVAPLVFFQK